MDIEVFRPKQFQDMARDYKLFADGKQVAVIKRGKTQTVSLPANTQVIQAKIDWCSSAEVKVSELSGTKITVKNTFANNIIEAMFFAWYYISFGKNKYLTIESSK
ncbi:hypothetical protein [Pseudoalteromonas spongiae]|uniref:hypothetical protein n=1 Tax=Pseudoalteromonas spongiae TaxID=298657 RepID=UPI00026CBE75|nr:hypothetical protein [Pseudoalteromonas spongiae]ATD01215.1 hypothetical protein PSPO_b1350 [Pseudoalteromonas spongiae UST010723-006]